MQGVLELGGRSFPGHQEVQGGEGRCLDNGKLIELPKRGAGVGHS